MSHRISALIAGAVVLGCTALPHAALAQSFYDDGAERPLVLHTQDDIHIDGDRARLEHRQDVRSGGFDDGTHRPVVYDERDPDRDRPAWGGRGYDRSGFYGRDDDRRADGWRDRGYGYGYGYRYHRHHYGYDDRYGYRRDGFGAPAYRGAYGFVEAAPPAFNPYRTVSAPIGPVYEDRGGAPDVGCTMQQFRSTTAVGWQKIVTHRTCYRR